MLPGLHACLLCLCRFSVAALLPPLQVRYNTYGSLNEARDNAIVVCHALTGTAPVRAMP